MKAGEVKFQDLLNGKIQYRVPLFQRTYSWKEENWQRLWDDILEIYALEPPRSHFIGAVVTQPIGGSPEHPAKYLLIDGQQRMMTLFIILACIRDAAKNAGEGSPLVEEIDDDCVFNKYAKNPDEREKMRPTQRDAAEFKAILAGEWASAAGQVGQACHFYRGVLKKGDLDGNHIDSAKLKSCVTDYLDLVSVRLDADDSAPRIFESLNNTGMALTASDLVRNHIFMSIADEHEQQVAYELHWMPMQVRMEEPSGNSALSDFFWRFLMMDGSLPRYDEVFEGMRGWIEEELKNGKTMVETLAELNSLSELYVRLWKPASAESVQVIKTQLERLNQWEVDVAYPFTLASMRRWQSGEIDEDRLLAVLKMIESYAVRRLAAAIPTNRLRRIFANMSGRIDWRDYVRSSAAYLMDNEWPTDKAFHEAFQTTRVYIPGRLSRTRLILTSLEQSYEHHEQIVMTDQITIEHLMPQTLNDDWLSELGDDALETHENYLHTVGNLTYSGYNYDMGNMPFVKKKETLGLSHFELNRRIIRAETWDANAIRSRAQELADRALAIWKRDVDAQA